MKSRTSYHNPAPRCGVCDRRYRSNAEAFACERAHDAEARAAEVETIFNTERKAA